MHGYSPQNGHPERAQSERTCTVLSLGLVEYGRAWELQRRLAQRRAEGTIGDTLLLLQHPHVYTMGRRGSQAEVLLSREALAQRRIQVYDVDRGGALTYHGPGQLVGYPILDIRRWGGGPVRYVRALEGALIETLRGFGVAAQRIEGLTGVWVASEENQGLGARKIASIGVRISRAVTTHGFALNVAPDLSYFDSIVACGIPGLEVTSMARELGGSVDITEVQRPLVDALGRHLELAMRWAGDGEREALLGGVVAHAGRHG